MRKSPSPHLARPPSKQRLVSADRSRSPERQGPHDCGTRARTKTAAEIGQELSVDYLVESSIQAEGGRLRVTATLIRVRDQEHVWSQSYEREPTSLLGLQQELSTAIAEQVRVQAVARSRRAGSDAGRRRTPTRTTPISGDGTLKAGERRRRTRARSSSTSGRSRSTPDYALAWSSLAFTYAGERHQQRRASARGGAARARTPPRTPSSANPNLAESQFAVGYVNWMLDWDWPAAEKALRLAIRSRSRQRRRRIEPWVTRFRNPAGRAKPSRAMRRARELDPLGAARLTRCPRRSRSRPATIPPQSSTRGAPCSWTRSSGSATWSSGRRTRRRARPIWRSKRSGTRRGSRAATARRSRSRATCSRRSGGPAKRAEVLRKLEADSLERYVPPYAMALVHAGLGERDDGVRVARQSLRRARRSPHLSDSRSEVGRLSGRRPVWRTPRTLRLRSEVLEGWES